MHHADANADVRKEGLITADQSDRTNKIEGAARQERGHWNTQREV